MRNAEQWRVGLREQGKRRVRHLTQAIAVVGGALTALFGVVFAEDASAVESSTPPVTGSTQSPTGPPSTTMAPSTPETGDTPTLQPPAEAPRPIYGGGGHVRSRSTP